MWNTNICTSRNGERRKYNFELSDVWSCGIILFALLNGNVPFEESQEIFVYKKIIQSGLSGLKFSKEISENAKETNFNFVTNSLISKNSSLSESYNTYTQNDYIFETNFFSQGLKTFESLAFLSDGFNILKPQKLKMLPYFKEKEGYN